MSNKPTFYQLRQQYGFDIPALASKARVEQKVVYYMLRGIPVEHAEAEKVLLAFTKRLHPTAVFTLQNVAVVLCEEEQ